MKSNKPVLEFDKCLVPKGVIFKVKNDPEGFFISLNNNKHIYPVGVTCHPTKLELITLSFRGDFRQLVDTGEDYEII